MSDSEPSDEFGDEVDRIEWARRQLPKIVGGLVVLYFVFAGLLGWNFSGSENWGQFGDYIGGIMNPLIAFAALYALVVSIRIQRRELKDTRKELSSQGVTARQQRAEQRFFDLLKLYEETVRALNVVMWRRKGDEFSPEMNTGKSALRAMVSLPLYMQPASVSDTNPLQRELLQAQFSGEAHDLKLAFDNWSPFLDHYFRVLFTILREAKSLLDDEHFRYVKFLRAQLNRDELILLALNMLFNEEGKKMRPYANQYGLLKHLPKGAFRAYAETLLEAEVFGQKFASGCKANTEATMVGADETTIDARAT
ncbi:MAG: putative phage abortive infection protein [Casimicrobium sp.]